VCRYRQFLNSAIHPPLVAWVSMFSNQAEKPTSEANGIETVVSIQSE
jgi:hypothetical protein